MTTHDPLSLVETGKRLRIAREAVDVTQAAAASAIGAARTTIVAIEQGQRQARIAELQKLAKLYGISINALLRNEAVHVDLKPRFRKLHGSSDVAASDASDLLASLAQAEVELEHLLGVERQRNYPPERRVLKGDVRTQAENDATELRHRFGLGASPISDIVTLLEMEMGIRVYVRRIDGSISGLFVYDDALGACMLLNANHRRERRSQTAAHELGHFVATRRSPEILHQHEVESSREERYANSFARAFLMPPRAVIDRFHELTAGSDRFTRRHVILLAHIFNVAREAAVRRLEELGLVKRNAWDWFEAEGGITDEQATSVLGDLLRGDSQKGDADRPTTLRLHLLAVEAMRQGLLSEGQVSRLLRVDRLQLREMLINHELELDDPDVIRRRT